MRSKLELWKIIDKYFDVYFKTGLCRVIYKCYSKNKITLKEYIFIEKELKIYGDDNTYFLGSAFDPTPRKEFIKKMIEKHSK